MAGLTPTMKLRQYVAAFIDGINVSAVLGSMGDSAQYLEDLSYQVNNQLTISTASGVYLDQRASEVGMTPRPPDLGMSDLSFRNLTIDVTARKQLPELIMKVLETFYGYQAVRANVTSTLPEPYQLADGMDFWFSLEDGITRIMNFQASDFNDISQATAQEVSGAITRYIASLDLNAFAEVYTDYDTSQNFVQMFGGARGPYSTVSVLGGQAQLYLQFPTIRDTAVAISDTVWQATFVGGSTYRFRWIGNAQPDLIPVVPGDTVLLYGEGFQENGFSGTYTVTNVRPADVSVTLDGGWFEISLPTYSGLLYVPPGTDPPPNSPGMTYSISIPVATALDAFFFHPLKALPQEQVRYALAWETLNSTLKIYMPATTDIVTRELIGATHVHLLKPANDFDITAGDPTILANQIQILSDTAITYPQSGYDNIGYGGTLNWVVQNVFDLPMDNFTHDFPLDTYYITTVTPTASQTGLNIYLGAYTAGTQIYVSNQLNGVIRVDTADSDYNAITNIFNIGPYTSAIMTVVNPSDPYHGLVLSIVSPAEVATSGSVPIIEAVRENFFTTIYCSEPTDIPTYTDMYGRTMSSVTTSVVGNVAAQDNPAEPFLGAYMVDTTANYALESEFCTSRQNIYPGQTLTTLSVNGILPNAPGFLLFDLGFATQESGIPFTGVQEIGAPTPVNIASISQNAYTVTVNTVMPHGAIVGSQVLIAGTVHFNGTYTVTAVPTPNSYVYTSGVSQVAFESVGTSTTLVTSLQSIILIDPAYIFQQEHLVGASVTLISQKTAYVPAIDGTDYSTFITGTYPGIEYAQEIIDDVTALGIKLNIVIVYTGDVGLGNAGDGDGPAEPISDVVEVYSGP